MAFCAASVVSTAGKANWPLALRVFGLGLLVALASLAGGFFLGFLFGIPKTRNQGAVGPAILTSPSGGEIDQSHFEGNPQGAWGPRIFTTPNSNLEDISDWLTKAIVGITLVTSTQIYALLKTFA
jgi:hypothetical protein